MALDGLSNQSVGIYRSKDPSQTTEKLNAKAKEKASHHLEGLTESGLVDKVDPDAQNNPENKNKKELIIYKANKLIEDEDDSQVLELVVEDEESAEELEYTISFNSETKLIEMTNIKKNEVVETVQPEELFRVISKAKLVSGVLCDRRA